MPTYVPGFQHDLFVSYAHVDDQPLPGVERGWVSTLVAGLRTLLQRKLGRPDNFDLWVDQRLARHVELTPQLLEAVESTATLVLVLSTGYVASPWCQRERETFLRSVAARGGSGSVFVVERDQVDEDSRPAELRDLLGFRFWAPDESTGVPMTLGEIDPSERSFIEKLNHLAHVIAEELKLRASDAGSETADQPPAAPAAGDPRTVFLAETTDDLWEQRERAARYLTQAGHRILPDHVFPRDPTAFAHALRADLEAADVFVQLLGPLAGIKPPELNQGYVRYQHELAVESGVQVVQWRSRDLVLEAVSDAEHRALLEGETVMAMGVEELLREILERLKPAAATESERPLNAFVFVNTEKGDWQLAESVCKLLESRRVAYALPLRSGSASEVRRDLEDNIVDCDALVIIYGEATAAWVREQLRFLRKTMFQRDKPMRALAIYQGPPDGDKDVGFMLPNMTVLDCRSGLDEKLFLGFLDQLAADRDAGRKAAGGGSA